MYISLRKPVLLFLWLAGFVLGGCSAPLVMLPSELNDQGLLVAQVSSQTMPGVLNGDPSIDGVKHIGGLRGGTVMVPLYPGEYVLEGFDETTGSSSVSYGYGTAYTRYYRWYTVGQSFKIEKGKATNIGMMVFEQFPGEQPTVALLSKPYFVDNQSEIEGFLRERHPTLYASLQGNKALQAGTDTLSQEELNQLRRKVASYKASDSRWQREHSDHRYITATLGTIAEVKRRPGGKVEVTRILDTGTVQDFNRCSTSRLRVGCVTGARSYLLVESARVVRRDAPQGVILNTMHVFGKRGLVLVDDYLRYHISLDDGVTWRSFEGAMRAKPIRRDSYDRIDMNSVEFVAGTSGFYAFERGVDGQKGPLVYADYAIGSFKTIAFPANAKNIKTVYETSTGLFIAPSSTEFAKGMVFFKAHDSTQWQERVLPKAGCSDMLVGDVAGQHLEVYCRGDNVFRSDDAGLTWQPVFLGKSLFNQ